MRSFIYLAVSALAAVAAAQNPNPFNVPKGGYDLTSGEPTTLLWDPTTDGTITLKLQVGRDTTPDSGDVIAKSIPNSGSFAFVPPSDVNAGTLYTVEIIDDTDPDNYNFTPVFTIGGGTGEVSTASAELSTTSAPSTTAEKTTIATATKTDGAETSNTTEASATGTTLTKSSASETETASGTSTSTSTDSESSSGTTTAEPTVQSTTAPGAGVSLKVHGGMFALVAGVMAAL